MPELPEVEIIKRGLQEKIVGKTIADVEVRAAKSFQGKSEDVKGTEIKSVERKAKMIVIALSNGKFLLIHLKLTGQLVFDRKAGDKSSRVAGGHPSKDWVADLPSKFTYVIFHFTDGGILYFNDLRKFGYIKVLTKDELEKQNLYKNLGPEPYSKDLTPEYLMKIFSRRPKAKIKQLIMDQAVIAGVGNIYADESLFCARIVPTRAAKDVKRSELVKILECLKKVMDFSIAHGGSSENTFVDVEGKQGKMQDYFRVYRKTGQKCPNNCGGVIKRITLGGRGTHFCPQCQQ